MDKEAVLKAIEGFREALSRHGVRADRVILYGSYSRGDWHDGSDIDLIVVSRDFEAKGFWERIDMLVDALMDVPQPIEAIAMTPEEWDRGDSMIAQCAKDGEVVYAA
jgi:predicted nucleotidyltransferase